MTQEDKELLLKDLCARLPYGVKMYHPSSGFILPLAGIDNNGCITIGNNIIGYYTENIGYGCKSYLRPMSSMTEEEKQVLELCNAFIESRSIELKVDFYNKQHLDYRGLISKGLALEAQEGMYEKKE